MGRNCITWIENNTRIFNTTIYSKIASNTEAGDVQRTFNTYLADLLICQDIHLRATFEDPSVVQRGCTQIEVSCRTPSIDCIRQDAPGQTLQVVRQVQGDGRFASVLIADHWHAVEAKIENNVLCSTCRPSKCTSVGMEILPPASS